MSHLESPAKKSPEAFSSPLSEKGRLIVSSREGNLIILSGKKEVSDSSFVVRPTAAGRRSLGEGGRRTDEIRPLRTLNLSERGIELIRNILQKNNGSLEKTAESLGAPLYWIKIVAEKYKLG